ncbi:MAG: Acylamidase [Acidimicrobiales bacterium]|nr:MAG: amidase [Actinomycetota bacterium]MBV6508510.1 Acylamidase [Acidimicrobiales bacterium]RIK05173.1 MAG: amidase [Acidobacteriota bacterium]
MDTVIEIAEAVRSGERKAVEVVEECLACISEKNALLNAFVHLDDQGALARAREIDDAVAAGVDPGPLAGVPLGVKDLEDCAGMPTSHGSVMYLDRGPVERDSIHVGRLRAAGAIPLGKTAAPELGTLQYTRTVAFGTTRNPWNPDKTPGGSSGGTAAAVAAGMVPMGTASDGGGSTRIPASFSGLFGLKPSFGRIPSEHPCTSQTAVFGALTTTVTDSARHLDVVHGPDDRDRTSLPPSGVRYEEVVEVLSPVGLRVAWSPDLGFAAVDPEVEAVTSAAAAALIDAAGMERVERSVLLTDPIRTWMSQGGIDLWAEHDCARWLERKDELTPFVRSSLEITSEATTPQLAKGFRHRWKLEEEVAEIFSDVDVLLTPTTAVPAFVAEGPPPDEIDGRRVHVGMSVPFTMAANLCWNPAASVPAGFTSEGLPVGLQIMGRRHADDVVLRLSRIFEQIRPWPRTTNQLL